MEIRMEIQCDDVNHNNTCGLLEIKGNYRVCYYSLFHFNLHKLPTWYRYGRCSIEWDQEPACIQAASVHSLNNWILRCWKWSSFNLNNAKQQQKYFSYLLWARTKWLTVCVWEWQQYPRWCDVRRSLWCSADPRMLCSDNSSIISCPYCLAIRISKPHCYLYIFEDVKQQFPPNFMLLTSGYLSGKSFQIA